jgi:hypothetical protein
LRQDLGMKKSAQRLFAIYLFGFALTAALSSLLPQLLSGKGLDADDDGEYLDDIMALFFGSQAATLTAMVPFFGTIIGAAAKRFNKNVYDDRISVSPLISTIETSLDAVAGVSKKLWTDDDVNEIKLTKDVLTAIGFATGTPVGAFANQAQYLMKTDTEFSQDPAKFTRGLATGKEE